MVFQTLTALHSCGKKFMTWKMMISCKKNEASDFETKAALLRYVPIDAPSRALIPLECVEVAASISEWYRPWLMKLPMRTAKIVAKPTGKIMTCHWAVFFIVFCCRKIMACQEWQTNRRTNRLTAAPGIWVWLTHRLPCHSNESKRLGLR